MNVSLSTLTWYLLTCTTPFAIDAFTNLPMRASVQQKYNSKIFASSQKNEHDENDTKETTSSASTRRDILRQATTATIVTATSSLLNTDNANALDILPTIFQSKERRSNGGTYIPAKRCTAYLVDSTIPPTLVPFKAQREAAILKNLGMGLGTSKEPYLAEALTLNNIAKKTVFGSGELVSDVVLRGGKKKDAKGGEGYASFVCMGVDYTDAEDAALAVSLMEDLIKPRKAFDTAVALEFAPLSTQADLDAFLVNGNEEALTSAMALKQVSATTLDTFMPLLKFARSKKLTLLAIAPEAQDVQIVRKDGLQSLNIDRREQYVVDTKGFIDLTQDEKFKLYTDRSLIKDFVPPPSSSSSSEGDGGGGKQDGVGDYFAERILVHEACATSIAKWAMKRADSMVVTVAPMKDVRYMGGINGRIPRICQVVNGEGCGVDESAVTTILLNPSAEETLSGSRYLRLEIGTAPKNLAYQTKIADYIWFSKMPKVNMLGRMMNPM